MWVQQMKLMGPRNLYSTLVAGHFPKHFRLEPPFLVGTTALSHSLVSRDVDRSASEFAYGVPTPPTSTVEPSHPHEGAGGDGSWDQAMLRRALCFHPGRKIGERQHFVRINGVRSARGHSAARPRSSPKIYEKEMAATARPVSRLEPWERGRSKVSPAEAREETGRRNKALGEVLWSMRELAERGLLNCTLQNVVNYIHDRFPLDPQPAKPGVSAQRPSPEELVDKLWSHGITMEDGGALAICLFKEDEAYDVVNHGMGLLMSLCCVENEEACIRMMQYFHLSPEVQGSWKQDCRKWLRELAEHGKNIHAMVLDAKLAEAAGDITRAKLGLLKAVERASMERTSPFELQRMEILDHRSKLKFADLDRPWRDLTEICDGDDARDEVSLKRALTVGCEHDDAVSHYRASRLGMPGRGPLEPPPEHTSAWLYHVTKAASNGHALAMHELGYFYAVSVWKYIDDEPPDDVKPTPFDSYPPARPRWSFMQRLRQHSGEPLGLIPSDREDLKREIFTFAVFPYEADQRQRLALMWLDLACSHGFAPSYVLKARLCLRKTIPAAADAPQAALQLHDSRYSRVSAQDPAAARGDGSHEEDEKEIPNSMYSREDAQSALASVFQLLDLENVHAQHCKRRSSGLAVDQEAMRQALQVLPRSEVRQMYLIRGQVCSDHGGDYTLGEEAVSLCNEHRLDIWKTKDTLWYTHHQQSK